MSPYARQCPADAFSVGTEIYRAGILSRALLNTESEIVFRRVRDATKSD